MRILQIVPSISLVYGGPSQMVLGLSSALAAEGIEVTILTTNSNGDKGQPPLDVPLRQAIAQDGYQVIYFACFPWRRYKFSPGLLQWFDNHASEYDLVHVHALFSPLSTAAAIIARQKGLPYILRPLGTLDPRDLQKKRRLKQIYAWLWERGNLAQASGVHFTSEKECEISQRFGVPTQDLIIPLGVNLPSNLVPKGQARQKLGIDGDSNLILFMSRIDPKKGLDLLITALEDLVSKGYDFQFVLAGSNPQDPEYERQIKSKIAQSPLSNRTQITGFVQGDFKYSLLQDADIFVLPSYYENFGIAVAEAMAMGIPVLISEQVYISPAIEAVEAGWVVSLSVESLVTGLETALNNPQIRQHRGKKALELARQKYNWHAIAKQTIGIYRQLIEEKMESLRN